MTDTERLRRAVGDALIVLDGYSGRVVDAAKVILREALNDGSPPSGYPAPKVCLYCDGEGNGSAGLCGFCDNGKPLDTQEDWDNSWGKVFRRIAELHAGEACDSEGVE